MSVHIWGNRCINANNYQKKTLVNLYHLKSLQLFFSNAENFEDLLLQTFKYTM